MGAVSDDQTLVRITAEPLSVDEALAFIAEPSSGGSCIFVGTVRDSDADGVAVTGLTYESWNDVAADRLREIANRLRDRWPIRKVALLHRTGDLGVGDASVVVAVSGATNVINTVDGQRIDAPEPTGGVVYRDPGATHTLTNVGDTTYIARLIEIKA